MKKLLLIGRPNVGKSTVFNALTNKNSRVSNYFQATVMKIEGRVGDYEIVDLPGIYDFSGSSADEKITLKTLEEGDYSKIIYVLKAEEYQYFLNIKKRLKSYNKEVIIVVTFLEESKNYLDFDLSAFSSTHDLKTIAYRNDRSFKGEFLKLIESKRSAVLENYGEVLTKKGSPYVGYMLTLDRIFLHPVFGLLLLFAFFFLLLFVSFFLVSGLTNGIIDRLQEALNNYLSVPISSPYLAFFQFLRLALVPTFFMLLCLLIPLFVLYFGIGLAEDFGYLGRVELLLTPLARRFGLSGRSFVSYILGTGCLIPAILSTRSLESSAIKKKTLFSLTYIPCGAKLPVIILLCRLFYPNNYFFMIIFFYSLSLIITLILAFTLFNKDSQSSATSLSIIPLPLYHKPSLKVATRRAIFDLSSFSLRIVGPVLIMNILIYFLSYYSFSRELLVTTENSILATISSFLIPIFRPIGIDSYQPIIALILGLVAKEETLGALLVLSNNSILSLSFNPLSFLIFFTLYNPCFLSYSALYKEDRNLIRLIAFALLQFLIAYILALIFA